MTSPVIMISGYAALFNERDLGGDTILPGAFYRGGIGTGQHLYPILAEHRPDYAIGYCRLVYEDEKGLRVMGVLDSLEKRPGYDPLRNPGVRGLSIGYRVWEFERDAQGRTLKSVSLAEVSITLSPMQPGCLIDFIMEHKK